MGESSIKTANVRASPLKSGNGKLCVNWTIFTNSFDSILNLRCSKVFAKLSLWILQTCFNYQDPQRSWIWFLRIFKILARFFKVLAKILKDPRGSSVIFEVPAEIFEDLAKDLQRSQQELWWSWQDLGRSFKFL